MSEANREPFVVAASLATAEAPASSGAAVATAPTAPPASSIPPGPTADAPLPALNPALLPKHVGIIMDGNGRWARHRGLARSEGHSQGSEAVRRVVRSARKLGLEALTLFAFSSQNWDRPPAEVYHLMQLLRRYLFEERREILDNGIRLITVGETDRLPLYVRIPLRELIAASSRNAGMTLCLALSYGGRETLTEAARAVAREAKAGRLDPETLDPERFSRFLPSSAALPPLDLLVRTSGERRISNFFLWEIAYAELAFSDTLWPDFGAVDLHAALADYAGRERRFGRVLDEDAPDAPDVPDVPDAPDVADAGDAGATG
jgi:undecaprenyl diphosphate synthase